MGFWHGLCFLIIYMNGDHQRRGHLASLIMIGVALVVMSPLQSADARSNPWYAPYSYRYTPYRYTPYDQRTPYNAIRSNAVCGDAIVQKPNSSGIQEVCDSGTNNGKTGYCDKTCSCILKAWYGDNDEDGFGSPYTIASCTKPAGKFTDKPSDWNDSLPTMYPGAPEICDGLDNNQNGQADEGIQKTFYSDNDSDGWGSPYKIQTCVKPPKFTDKPGDWNDSLPTMYPGAPEICDKLDNNQNGQADEGIQIDDSNLCTDDYCMGGNVYHNYNSKTCNDNSACTSNDVCKWGKCSGAPVTVTPTYSEWGVCQANSIQTRTVTFNPPGCGSTTGLLLAQKCSTPQPSPPQPPAPFWPGQKKLAVGFGHICAFSNSGKLQCWGDNKYGQLGNGKLGPEVNPYPQDVQFSPGDVPMSVAAGGYKTCSPLSTGAVKCWGDYVTTPTAVATITSAKAVVLGYKHICALLTTGTLKCWGDNKFGQLGDGTTNASSTPVDVSSLSNVINVAAGSYHTCALIKGGIVKCWGSGTLGNNSTVGSVIPVTVLLTKPATSIMSGESHACAIMDDSTLQCWGNNHDNQLGPMIINKISKFSEEVIPYYQSPITIAGLNIIGGVEDLALGSNHTCVLGSAGSWVNTNVLCLGGNNYGQIGVVSATVDVDKPTKVTVPNPVTSIAAGGNTTCAVILNQATGTSVLQCWGDVSHGELGSDPSKQSGLKSTILNYPGQSITIYYAATPIVVPNISVGTPAPPPSVCGEGLIWDMGSKLCACPSGKKWDTAGKQCVAYTGNGGGSGTGSGTVGGATNQKDTTSATKKYWVANKPKVDVLMTKLVTDSNAVITTKSNLQKEAEATLEPIIKTIIESKNKQTPPVLPVAKGMTAYAAAEKELQSTTKQLVDILVAGMKQDGDYPVTAEIRETLAEMSMAFMNTVFTASVKLPLSDATKADCIWNIVNNQTIYNLGKKQTEGMLTIGTFVSTINNCLPQQSVNMLDEALTSAWIYTIAMVKGFHPAYADYIKDYEFGLLSSVIPIIFERTRFQGPHVPSRKFMQEYADRIKLLTPGNSGVTGGANIIPSVFMLYNPTSKKAEEIKFCLSGFLTSPDMVWNETYKCVYYPNLIKTIMDLNMDKAGTCSFWDTARLGKPCMVPPQETGWLDVFRRGVNSIAVLLENPFISTAYAANPQLYCTNKNGGGLGDGSQWGYDEETCSCVELSALNAKEEAQSAAQKMANEKGAASCPNLTSWSQQAQACKPFCYIDIPCKSCEEPKKCPPVTYNGQPNWEGWDKPVIDQEKCMNDYNVCIAKWKNDLKKSCNGKNYCGNYISEKINGEECDDGNNKNGDGCSIFCKNEIPAICGNSKLETGEECDDGNTKDGDGCSNACKKETPGCGNTKVEYPEECDHGEKNGTKGDSCNSECKKIPQSCYEQCLDDVKTGKLKKDVGLCKSYVDSLDQISDPNFANTKIPATPWDDKPECKLTPFKKGDPMWKQLQHQSHKCQKEPALMACIQKCKEEKPWFVPPSMQEECKNTNVLPGWSNGFDSAGAREDLIDHLLSLATLKDPAEEKRKKLAISTFNEHFSTVGTLLSNLVGVPFPEVLLQEAREYGMNRISSAKPCEGTQLAMIQALGGSAAFFSQFGMLCENPQFFDESNYFIVQNAQTLAHEGVHAALMKVWTRMHFSLSEIALPGCGLDDYFDPDQKSPLDHWLLDYFEPMGFINNAKTPWATSSTSVTYDPKGATCRAILNHL